MAALRKDLVPDSQPTSCGPAEGQRFARTGAGPDGSGPSSTPHHAGPWQGSGHHTTRARRSNDESGKVEWQKMSGEDDSVTKRKVRWHGTVDVQQLASPSRLDGGKR